MLEEEIFFLCDQLNNCEVCRDIFEMQHYFCCLHNCNKRVYKEKCDECIYGIHHPDFKEWERIYKS